MIDTLYDLLLKYYGPRGWWPISLSNPLPRHPYHVGDYTFPKNDAQRLEIALGAILTQNTAWKNVTQALADLSQGGLFSVSALLDTDLTPLGQAIRKAGYFNQKANYIKAFVEFLQQHPFGKLAEMSVSEARAKLLTVKGIGFETADCILLYALGQTVFVVDAYSKRFLRHLGWISPQATYAQVQSLFQQALPLDLPCYQEYHALLVEHGKGYYSKKPYGLGDPFLKLAQLKSKC